MVIIADKLKKEVRIKVYNIARQAYLKRSICNIGRIVEEDDKIICYVEQKKVNRYKGDKPIYELELNGMNQVTEENKEVVKSFRLNKPIYYIFDGIKFNSAVIITSLWSNVTFRNCIFDKNIGIIWGNEITFQNNKYMDHCPVYFYGKCFLTADSVNRLTFINDNFFNSCDLYNPTRFGMHIDAKLVEFINTNVETEYPATVNIKAEKTRVENSSFNANEIYVDSESIEFTDSSIYAENGVMIENKNCDFIGDIDAPIIFYNGVDMVNKNNESFKVDEKEKKLKSLRILLIQKLQSLNNYCKEQNNKKITSIEEQLEKRSVGKMLIRK